MTRIALLSTSDTDLLSARACGAGYALGNPARIDVGAQGPGSLDSVLGGADIVVVRILGSARSWQDGLDEVRGHGVPVVVLGGEQTPDAELMAHSTVPIGTAAQAHRYLAYGGPENLAHLHAFLSDTVLLTGTPFAEPVQMPEWGVVERDGASHDGGQNAAGRPRVGLLYYRAHHVGGNRTFVADLADAVEAAGGQAVPIFCSSLRSPPEELLAELGGLDALVVTVLAAGGRRPAQAGAGGDDEAWDVDALAALDIPILQGLCLTWDRESWAGSDEGVSPMDAASQIAVPEFDGRIITTAFSFKEFDSDGLPRYVTDPERCRRVAGIAVAHARLRHVPVDERRIVVMLSAYPTKHSRVGNAVGLDTPASAVRVLRAMRDAGYDLGDEAERPWLVLDPAPGTSAGAGTDQGTGGTDVGPAYDADPDTVAGNLLIHTLIDAGGQDEDWLTAEQLAGSPVRVPTEQYRRWTADLPESLTAAMRRTWGEAPGELFTDYSADSDGEIVLATLQAGNVVLMIQPPRGFGENPVSIYHDPELPPSHHYMAAYRWIEQGFGAHAVVHLGKHGTLEWLPGKNAAQSAHCGTDAALGNLPMIYPFLVNDPGEGAQAKRRAHSTIVDHLIPPMARAESYGDIARLEQLLDEHQNLSAMDPAKLPAIRSQIWTLIRAAELDSDLGLDQRPDDDAFDDILLDVDGWLCEIKDAQIRDGLHILGGAPDGHARIDLVLSMLRAAQVWGGTTHALPGLRTALGLAGGESADGPGIAEVDAAEKTARSLIVAMEDVGWDTAAVPRIVAEQCGPAEEPGRPDEGGPESNGSRSTGTGAVDTGAVAEILTFAAEQIVPRLARTTDEITAILRALDGRFIAPGPSGSPLRGLVNVLPTGRNFYTVDPKAIPSRLAWDTGRSMADSLVRRYLDETGEYPTSVGLSAWGTSAMRTSGDDIAEVLALIGVRPRWDEESRRVMGLDVVGLEELGRPRIDVTVRISGFFRDAFPHVIALLDDAFAMVAALDETDADNFVRAHVALDTASHGDERRARTRIFGSKPGAYGAGILQVIESGNWRDDSDLAEVYTAWGGFAYGRDLHGEPAAEDMRANYARIAVAAKNTDTREHDIADSDDYFQYHGGMIATIRALTGTAPRSYIGDSTTPDAVRTRSLGEETARVFRSRVVNPRWMKAMRRHGYKGAFEMAATVDYLYGYDATASVVHDWMYESLAQNYALDETNQEFLREVNPWALHGIIERLTEAADRGLWAEPDPSTLDAMRRTYLEVEGDLEDRG